MTSFTRTWDASYEADPADIDQASGGATDIRQVKVDVKERIDVDHMMDGDAQDGEHKKLTMPEQAASPTNVANKGFLYTKDVGGVTELHYIDSAGNELVLTAAGLLNAALNANSMEQSSGLNVKAQMSIQNDDGSGILLDGDEDAPGNSKLYGTDSSGTKGWQSAVISKEVNLGNPTISTEFSAAHGFGALPDLMSAWIECTTTDRDWAVGDRVLVEFGNQLSVAADTTNILGRTSGITLTVLEKDSPHGSLAITPGSWDLIVIAYKL